MSFTVYPRRQCHSLKFLFRPRGFFCAFFCCIKCKLLHLAFLAFPGWHVALSLLAVSSCGRSYMSLLVQTFLFFDLGSPVQGRSRPVPSKPITLLKLYDHSPTKEPHLWQLGHHRFVKLTLSHTSQPNHHDLPYLRFVLYYSVDLPWANRAFQERR